MKSDSVHRRAPEGPVALRKVYSRGMATTKPALGLISVITPPATAALMM